MKTCGVEYPVFIKRRKNMQGCQVQTISRNIPVLSGLKSARKVHSPQDICPGKALEKTVKVSTKENRRLKILAEAMILQSIEDLWNKAYKKKSIEFFTGEGFNLCADIAGMRVIERLRLISMLRRVDARIFKSKHAKEISRFTIV